MYIVASAIISHQPTFLNKGYSASMQEISNPSELIQPDYSEYISPIEKRRMSEVLKMSVTCAKNCLQQAGTSELDAIIVGTGMGCGAYTRSFIKTIFEAGDGIISPTAFTLSTHNTIAGQISILLNCKAHNMTHTQNSLSLEYSLMDGEMNLMNEKNYILVGAAEERDNELFNIRKKLNHDALQITSGAAFFILTQKTDSGERIKIRDVFAGGLITDTEAIVREFLVSNNVSNSEIDLVLFSTSNTNGENVLRNVFTSNQVEDFQKYCATYIVNNGFALGMAVDILQLGYFRNTEKKVKRILIFNNLIPENLGLILLEKEV